MELAVPVLAVSGGVLRNQADFNGTAFDQCTGFADDVVDGAANLFAADFGNGAEGAGIGAAFGNFEVGGVRGAGAQARLGEEFGVALQLHWFGFFSQQTQTDFGQSAVVGEGGAGVGGFEEAFGFGRVGGAFNETAERDNRFGPAGGFQFVQHARGLFAGVFDEAAGVHQTDIGFRRFFGNHPSAFNKTTENQFGVDGVFGATQRNEGDDGSLGVRVYGGIIGVHFLYIFHNRIPLLPHSATPLLLPEAREEEDEDGVEL